MKKDDFEQNILPVYQELNKNSGNNFKPNNEEKIENNYAEEKSEIEKPSISLFKSIFDSDSD